MRQRLARQCQFYIGCTGTIFRRKHTLRELPRVILPALPETDLIPETPLICTSSLFSTPILNPEHPFTRSQAFYLLSAVELVTRFIYMYIYCFPRNRRMTNGRSIGEHCRTFENVRVICYSTAN